MLEETDCYRPSGSHFLYDYRRLKRRKQFPWTHELAPSSSDFRHFSCWNKVPYARP